jgi:hypothetical protein
MPYKDVDSSCEKTAAYERSPWRFQFFSIMFHHHGPENPGRPLPEFLGIPEFCNTSTTQNKDTIKVDDCAQSMGHYQKTHGV